MSGVSDEDLDTALDKVLSSIEGINSLYPNQYEVLKNIVNLNNVYVTSPTNSGKTIPPVILPSVIRELRVIGYDFPVVPRVLYVTNLNSIQLSLLASLSGFGIDSSAVTSGNVEQVLNSGVPVLFVGPEVLQIPLVTKTLLKFRHSFVCKVLDECHLG